MEQLLFGSEFQSAQELLRGEDDPVKLWWMDAGPVRSWLSTTLLEALVDPRAR